MAPSFATRWLLPRLQDFRSKYPEVKVELQPSIEVCDFRKSSHDVAIRHGKGRWPGLTSTKLFDEYLVPVASPAYAEAIDPDGFWRETLVSASPRKKEWQTWIESHVGEPAPELKLILYPTQALALDAAVAGGCIALADKHLIENDVREKRLLILHDKPLPNGQGFYIAHRKGPVVEAKVQAFCKWVIEQLQ